MVPKKIVIIGAGLAGLSAARFLQTRGIACDVFEQEAQVGGLCRTHHRDGFSFDFGGHLLHFKRRQTERYVRRLLGGRLKSHQRSAWVYAHRSFVPYPFQANLFALPEPVRDECLDGFLRTARKKRTRPGDGDFRSWILRTFGEGIARHFMVPYNTKFWTVPPERLTCSWLDGFIPVPTRTQVITGARRNVRSSFGYNSRFLYPGQGGIQQLPEALAEGLTGVRTGCRIRCIDLGRRTVTTARGETFRYDRLISTLALPELPGVIPGLAAEVRRACSRLRWNSILNLNIGFTGGQASGKHWVYVPQKDVVFFRVGFFHNFSRSLVPRDACSLYAEVSYDPARPLPRRAVRTRVFSDLRRIGILNGTEKMRCCQVNDIRYGYPVYDRHYAPSRQRILTYLKRHGVVSCGRYGNWQYMSMEQTMHDGFNAALRAL